MSKGRFLIYWFLGILACIIACKTSLKSNPSESTAIRSVENAKNIQRLDLLKLSDLSGHPVRLSDYAGKPVFLNFWATWCAPCRSEMESITEVSKQFKNDIHFLLASNEDTTKIRNFITEHNFDLNYLHLDISYIDVYVTELPTTFLIDRNGKLISEEEGFRIWTQENYVNQLKKLIAKLD